MNSNNESPRADASLRPWRECADGSVHLLAARIGARRTLHFPPPPAMSPLQGDSELVELLGTPVLYSFTIVHSSPKAQKAPQPLGQIDFPEGVRVFGRLELPEGRRPRIAEPLRVVLRGTDEDRIYAFEPLEELPA